MNKRKGRSANALATSKDAKVTKRVSNETKVMLANKNETVIRHDPSVERGLEMT